MKRWIVMSLSAVALTGCFGPADDDLTQWMNEEGVRAKANSRIEPLPEYKPQEGFEYTANTLPDPFSQSKMDSAKKQGQPAQIVGHQPQELEKYDLEKLQMVGVLQQGKLIQALVKDPTGTLHRVSIGSYMGQNFGVVVSISETEVKLKEIVEDSSGGWKEQPASLYLVE